MKRTSLPPELIRASRLLDGCPLNAEGFSTAVDGLVIES
jgi:hypothetical protein